MESLRFEKFTLLIHGIHKCMDKLKTASVSVLGVKSVHILWLYQLSRHKDGLTATEIANLSMIDRSLVSREIEALMSCGYITKVKSRRYALTEEGHKLADKITEMVMDVQREADEGISEEELASFYETLEKLNDNFTKITKKKKTIK